MDMNRKLALADSAIKSISQHDDEDVALRDAALDRIEVLVKNEREAMHKRVEDRIAATIAPITG